MSLLAQLHDHLHDLATVILIDRVPFGADTGVHELANLEANLFDLWRKGEIDHAASLVNGAPEQRARRPAGSVASTSMSSTNAGSSWDRDTLPEGDEKKQAVREMFDAIAPRYDMVNRIMTFRLDVRWRRQTVHDLALPTGSIVLDLASGTGDLCIDLRESGLTPISMDLSFGMLDGRPFGRSALSGRHPSPTGSRRIGRRRHVRFRAPQPRSSCPPSSTSWRGSLRPGGRIALLDVGIPKNKAIRFGNNIYFGKVVPRIGALLCDGAAYRYLPKSVAYLPAPAEMIEMLRAAGFADASHRLLSGGLTQQLLGTRD